jgi:sialate O-acetylesterase
LSDSWANNTFGVFSSEANTYKVQALFTPPSMKTHFRLLLLSLFFIQSLLADVTPNPLFSDNGVLQRGIKIPVWGTAANGEKVTVEFAGQKVSTTATNGSWMVFLQPLDANTNSQTMTLSGSNTITLTNLLIGEVWICSGQSNMERQLGPRNGQKLIANYEAEAAAANYPQIRHFQVKQTIATNPLTTVSGSWAVCSPSTVTNFTAVGYFFGRDLHNTLGVPIGLIHSSWGGTPAETWTRHEALESNPALVPILQRFTNDVASYATRLAQYQADEPRLKADYTNACALAVAQAKPTPRPPSPPKNPLNWQNSPSMLFNGMLNPVIPYAMRGVIWYQGESNGGRAKEYRDLFPAMIADWRALWGEGNFPFLYVQVAPFKNMGPEIREAQFLTLAKTTNTAMAVIMDHGDSNDIHPIEKQPVGARLALAAEALAYDAAVEYSGPLFKGCKINNGEVVISFTHVGMGLVAKGGPLKGFVIAGADKKFVPAQAEILGNTVVVSSPQVPVPAAVRYGWANVPDGNLFNTAGLPASPFRTDVE